MQNSRETPIRGVYGWKIRKHSVVNGLTDHLSSNSSVKDKAIFNFINPHIDAIFNKDATMFARCLLILKSLHIEQIKHEFF